MGNGIATLCSCLTCGHPRCRRRRRHDVAPVAGDALDDGLGHSFCYLRPDPLPKPAATPATAAAPPSSKVHHSDDPAAGVAATTFRAISGAAVSANTATPPLSDVYAHACSVDRSSAAFEGTTSFAAIPLQPLPRSAGGGLAPLSGPIERGFMSGPIERGFLSGPLDRAGLFSGPLAGDAHKKLALHRSFSHGGLRSRKNSLIRAIKKAISKSVAAPAPKPPILPKDLDQWVVGDKNMVIGPENLTVSSTTNLSSELSLEDEESMEGGQNSLQWAQGKAGEDRVHVVVSEEHGWVFVGIYDGFNGPDAPDYLLSHLYQSVHHELKGRLLKDGNFEYQSYGGCNDGGEPKKWRSEWERERVELERRLKEQLNRSSSDNEVNHSDVLKAMSEGLRKTEEAYFEVADQMLVENPELALMGACVLVMLMKGEHVYLMNVGDSRAVLARCVDPSLWELLVKDRDNENSWQEMDHLDRPTGVNALQLSVDHSTSVEEVNLVSMHSMV